MFINKNLINSFVEITSKAAIAAYNFIGKKDKILADKAAVDIMRYEINKLNIDGKIVIGEGELDEAPMLYIGEKIGTGKGKSIDIAVDPVEGTNFVANNLPGGLSVIAFAVAVRYSYLYLGLFYGTALSFAVSVVVAYFIYKIIEKKMG